MDIIPFGNRIIVKPIEKTDSKWVIPEGIEQEFSSWAEIVALPEHKLNKYLNKLKVGDWVAYKFFGKDYLIHPTTSEKYLTLEAESGVTKGQIEAIYHRNHV